MKRFFLSILLMSTVLVPAQDLQNSFFKQVTSNTYILFEDELLKDEAVLQDFVSKFGKNPTYTQEYSIQVNDLLNYEMGEIKSNAEIYSVLFIHSKKANNTIQIEFLIMYKKDKTNLDPSVLDATRGRWMELCNAHKVAELVSELYQNEAYYYNRGRLLQGTSAISSEYGYMKSPNYSLQLTSKYIAIANDRIAFEIGRCSGSYPLPYLLVWQKQEDGKWLVLMDSNY